MKFDELQLSEHIKNALKTLNYKEPTKVQESVLPLALKNKDLIVRAQTGSGKTASFGIPICENIQWIENKPQALIIAPTRELAVQIKDELSNIGRYKRLKAIAIYGRDSFDKQKIEIKSKTHIVVGTPGRLLDHLEKGTINLNHIKYLVLDEADEMLNMGFLEQVTMIVQRLPRNRVTMLFSATQPEGIIRLSKDYMKDPIQIEVDDGIAPAHITHSIYKVEEEEKLGLLQDVTVMENPDSCIIFCQTKERVELVFNTLNKEGYSCDKIHGDMEQKERLEVVEGFKRGRFPYLIATDVIARGIDVDNISLVINMDIPTDKEVYVHRSGRTGRKGLQGSVITFATEYEQKYRSFIERYMNISMVDLPHPTKEEVAISLASFKEKMRNKPIRKVLHSDKLNKDIVKLHFNGGKNKKLRTVHFVATIANIEGVTADDIGIITILERATYVDILNGKGDYVLKAMENKLLNGKTIKVTKSKK